MLKKTAQRTLHPEDVHTANHLAIKLSNELRSYKQDNWLQLVSFVTSDDKSLWRLTKALKRRGANPKIEPLQGSHGSVFANEEKAQVFAEHLENVFSDVEGQPQYGSLRREVDLAIANIPIERRDTLRAVSREEILRHIGLRKNGMVPGADGIANTALQ